MERRPTPESLLKRAQEEERQEKRGKLKIYLGAAPGVGKTYTMLQDALTKRAQGLDVVVGVVESHGRKEVENLLKDFEILPRQAVDYRDKKLQEFDLDAAIKRDPGLILIDEMAHTNVPGLRHAKRWQDIKEILDLGIDVYTTLNVQHVESLNDVVSQIINTRIKETVPDSMIEMADIIELIDLPPEDLLKRLQEGKVYFPKQAELARDNFFRKGNLIALRELALRTTAERVGAQVLLYRQGQGIKHIWPTKDKILVCVGSGTQSIKLIRAARRLATRLQADWIAVHVDAPRLRLTEAQRNIAIQHLRLAEQLGAETAILNGFDIVEEVLNFAREQNITQIVIGKRPSPRWKDLFFSNLADELIRHSKEIDVYVVTGEPVNIRVADEPVAVKHKIPWRLYVMSVFLVSLATLINFLLFPYLDSSNFIMVYLLGVTIVALSGRLGPSIFASILSIFAFTAFFTPPLIGFTITDLQYFLTLLGMFIIAFIITNLTRMTRRQAEESRRAEQRLGSLHTLSRLLGSTRGLDKILMTAVRFIGEEFDSDVLALLPDDNRLVIRAGYKTEPKLSEKELGVAQWVFDLGQVAGVGTDTLPFSDALYVPLLASKGTLGVLRIHPSTPNYLFTPEKKNLLIGCANQIAVSIEVDRLQEQRKKSELQVEKDRARSSLLQAVSQDLHTPLSAVMGAASTLVEMSGELDGKQIKKLGRDIQFELEQLSRLLNNILQVTYLEAESVKLQKEPQSLIDLINLVIKLSGKRLGDKPVNIRVPGDLPKIPFDHALMQAVFVNLIDNAIKFTPLESPIDISAHVDHDKVVVAVEDNGPGIVPDEVNKLFEKYYRGRMLTTERGLGLGLAICRSVIKAHGGKIWAENRPGGGAAFRFTLPLH